MYFIDYFGGLIFLNIFKGIENVVSLFISYFFGFTFRFFDV